MTPEQLAQRVEGTILLLQGEVRQAVAKSVALAAIARDDKILIQVSLGELGTLIRELGMPNGLELAARIAHVPQRYADRFLMDLGLTEPADDA
jgi:hypothetical protein